MSNGMSNRMTVTATEESNSTNHLKALTSSLAALVRGQHRLSNEARRKQNGYDEFASSAR